MPETYVEFCKLMGLEPSPETFELWLLFHNLSPDLRRGVFKKRQAELAAH